jgi:hypothetical protein
MAVITGGAERYVHSTKKPAQTKDDEYRLRRGTEEDTRLRNLENLNASRRSQYRREQLRSKGNQGLSPLGLNL